mgnify:CR=1 FL=1
MPAHDVSPLQGQFLSVLLQGMGAKRVLEIGTLGGYSTIWMARALPAGGQVFTLEIDPARAEVARKNFARAAVQDRITLLEGPAAETMRQLVERREAGDGEAFDFIFIDADKINYLKYYRRALDLLSPTGVILIDNVLWDGDVLKQPPPDEKTAAIQELNRTVAGDSRVTASLVTIRDGVLMVRKKAAV